MLNCCRNVRALAVRTHARTHARIHAFTHSRTRYKNWTGSQAIRQGLHVYQMNLDLLRILNIRILNLAGSTHQYKPLEYMLESQYIPSILNTAPDKKCFLRLNKTIIQMVVVKVRETSENSLTITVFNTKLLCNVQTFSELSMYYLQTSIRYGQFGVSQKT